MAFIDQAATHLGRRSALMNRRIARYRYNRIIVSDWWFNCPLSFSCRCAMYRKSCAALLLLLLNRCWSPRSHSPALSLPSIADKSACFIGRFGALTHGYTLIGFWSKRSRNRRMISLRIYFDSHKPVKQTLSLVFVDECQDVV